MHEWRPCTRPSSTKSSSTRSWRSCCCACGRKADRRSTDLFKIYLAAYASFRFFVEFVRGNTVVWGGLSGSQLFLLPSMVLLAAYFLRPSALSASPPASASMEPADA